MLLVKYVLEIVKYVMESRLVLLEFIYMLCRRNVGLDILHFDKIEIVLIYFVF